MTLGASTSLEGTSVEALSHPIKIPMNINPAWLMEMPMDCDDILIKYKIVRSATSPTKAESFTLFKFKFKCPISLEGFGVEGCPN